ncbi:MAG: START domain-containing protein [Aquirhabdus sp.]
MKKLLSTIVLIASTFVTVSAWAETESKGHLSIDRDGVQVWTYKQSGNPSVNYRATTVLESTLSGAVALVMDLDHCPEWAPYTGKSLILDRDTQAGTFTFRMDINFPFPLKNRDVLLTARMSQNSDGIVTIKNTVIEDPRAPIRPNFIRIDQYQGSWQFKPLPKTASGKPQVEVTTSGYAQPNGLLPIRIVNLFVHEQPFQMLRNMKNYVKNPRYQQATVEGVKEVQPKGAS